MAANMLKGWGEGFTTVLQAFYLLYWWCKVGFVMLLIPARESGKGPISSISAAQT